MESSYSGSSTAPRLPAGRCCGLGAARVEKRARRALLLGTVTSRTSSASCATCRAASRCRSRAGRPSWPTPQRQAFSAATEDVVVPGPDDRADLRSGSPRTPMSYVGSRSTTRKDAHQRERPMRDFIATRRRRRGSHQPNPRGFHARVSHSQKLRKTLTGAVARRSQVTACAAVSSCTKRLAGTSRTGRNPGVAGSSPARPNRRSPVPVTTC